MSSILIDAAYPPPAVPVGVSGVLGYIGGAADHVWTAHEWQPFAAIKQFPIWVADLAANPVAEGQAACKAAKALGWAAHMPAGQNRLIVIDLEAAVNRYWYARMAGTIDANGFTAVCYGSLDTVLGNAAADVLAADWDGIPSIPAGQTLHGLQYRANVSIGSATVDYDVVDAWFMARGGVGPRRGA